MATRSLRFTSVGRKIVAIGRNYAEHATELGNAVPTTPVVFLKPVSSYLHPSNGPIQVPSTSSSLHHEVELCVVIGKDGAKGLELPSPSVKDAVAGDPAVDAAMAAIEGYALGLDMTERNVQSEAKEGGLPWTVAKGRDTYAPISGLIGVDEIGEDPHNIEIWAKVDGQVKQKGTPRDMIFSIPYLVAYLSNLMTLEEGDVIMTGTPEGVGPVVPGNTIEIGLNTLPASGSDPTPLLQLSFDVDSIDRPI